MNGEKLRKLSNKELAVVSLHDAATSTSNPFVEDDRAPRRSTEDDNNVPFTFRTDITAIPNIERDPLFIFNSCNISEPSSEILIDPKKTKTQTVLRKNYDTKVRHADGPSTSKEHPLEVIRSLIIYDSDSSDELQMMDINLQSENEIPVDDPDNEHESIVLAYLKNKDVLLDIEGTILSTKKKSSILESVPKMETIIEGEQFYTFRPDDNEPILNKESSDTKEETNEPQHNISLEKENSLDVRIPSYPGSPRSIRYESGGSVGSLDYARDQKAKILRDAVNFLHCDNDYLHFAEMGDDMRLELAIRPSLKVAKLLFDHGANLLPRTSPVDTGLFLQFVMMCIPTREDAKILRLLIEKGALINDPHVPGGRSALHFAAMSNNCDLIRVLLNLGANLLAVNHRGQTPKDVAVTFHCKAAAELLGLCMEDASNE
ncbi:hypothetical protein MSG28_013296 [Choristoneura fumiferana]|uniref:Uncharacterized protein n=1 Tax=Choristoneura fumiferana TaxID=7141 RepID=A0ACC0KTB3_CHOFU|nr:hypothetical protein MSG28_013296 [Choristoneura fumiferana]